ncbi:hypothetical protein [Vulcanisaeta souniana]|uniref:hypothetical protein n=1 Tax=Vulcanisaeta souniana TaxID=164452 RepID=UPI000A985ED2|nr:hypothetical protein [Vulcanisaeta souniana]
MAILTIVLAYMAAYVSGYVKPLELTYNAMEDAYAIDSLYYVLSLILVAAGGPETNHLGGWQGSHRHWNSDTRDNLLLLNNQYLVSSHISSIHSPHGGCFIRHKPPQDKED